MGASGILWGSMKNPPLPHATSSTTDEPARGTPSRKGPSASRGYEKDKAQLLRRLARMEGQVRGIGRMVEREEYCIDILQQTSALRAAVDAVTLMLLEDHVAGCLTTAVRTGQAAVYTEEVM